MGGQHRLVEQGIAHQRAARFDKAAAIYRQVIQVDPENAPALELLTEALEAQGQMEAAVEAARAWVRTNPTSFGPRYRLASLLLALGQYSQSIDVWRDFAARTDRSREAVIALSQQLTVARRGEEALDVIEEAAARSPDDSYIRFEAARVFERLGRMEEARAHIAHVGAAFADRAEYQVVMARIEAGTEHEAEARARLERAAATPQGGASASLHNNLALLMDRAGEYDAAFAVAEKGRAIAYSCLSDNLRDGLDMDRVIQQTLSLTRDGPGGVASWPSVSEKETPMPLPPGVPAAPVFVVGFPRSGTTLVEQMLGAHPAMAVSDELPILRIVWKRLFSKYQPRGEYPRDLGTITRRQAAEARRWYLELAYSNLPRGGSDGSVGAAAASGNRRRIVDKQPYTTAELCFVQAIFPESPVIYVMRDPRDTVTSVMLQAFARGVGHLYTLEGAARLFDLFARVWEHSQKILDLKTMVVRYEDLVADQQTQARRMIEFVREAWSDAVVNYHAPEHRRYVTTPSYADVSKPVYSRAMGRWKNYEKHLAPVLPVLEPWVKAWGYQ